MIDKEKIQEIKKLIDEISWYRSINRSSEYYNRYPQGLQPIYQKEYKRSYNKK